MTRCSLSTCSALLAPLALLLGVGALQYCNADLYPPAVGYNGAICTGSNGSYSGQTSDGISFSVYVSGNTATLSTYQWQDGYFAGGWEWGNDDWYWDPNLNWVNGTWNPCSSSGTYSRGVFSIPGYSVSSFTADGLSGWPVYPAGVSTGTPVAGGPPELWVNGMEFYRYSTADTDYYYSLDYFDFVTIQGTNVTFSGSQDLTGTWTPNVGGGLFLMSSPTMDLRPLAANGSMMHTTAATLSGPPGVSVNGQAWPFQGSVDGVDYYMGSDPGQQLSIASTLAVTLNDPDSAVSNATGTDNNGVFQDLPETVRSLDAHGTVMASEGRGPASVVVNGVAWVHSNVGGAAYDAYFGAVSGQMLYIYGGTVWLSDPVTHVDSSSGTFAGGVFQMDNAGEQVLAGDQGGALTPATPQNRTQDSASDSIVQGNMDVFGNVLTLGTWQGDTTTAGLSLGFVDRPPSGGDDAPSAISLVAYRGANRWMWSHATSAFTNTMPMMQLDSANRLTLYSPVDGTVQVELDPQGTSTFHGPVRMQGPLRVSQRGDLSMGSYTSSPGQ